jgi:beta-phosphoglucomutase-like phosphatase (HAD superfamily)
MSNETGTAMEKEIGEATSPYVLLFELEAAAVNGRSCLYEAARSVFEAAGLTLTHQQFSRSCNQSAAPAIIERLIAEHGDGKLVADATDTIKTAYRDRLAHNAQVHPMFAALLQETSRRGMRAVALTLLPRDTADAVLQTNGLSGKAIDIQLFDDAERHFPRTECWMKVCRQFARSPRACVAVTGCRDAGKAALSSGMRCIIIPDDFTGFQDFSGVDAVLDSPDAYDLPELINQLT